MFPTNHKTFSAGRPKALFDETKVSPGASPTTANTEIELKLSADSKSLARVRQIAFWSGSQRAQTRVLDSVTSIQFATTCGPVAFDPSSKGGAAISEISAFKPDLLLTDFVMAQVDGLGSCRELKKRSDFDRMKIIFVFSKVEAYWREQANEVGAIVYIEKPLDTKSFSGTVASLVLG